MNNAFKTCVFSMMIASFSGSLLGMEQPRMLLQNPGQVKSYAMFNLFKNFVSFFKKRSPNPLILPQEEVLLREKFKQDYDAVYLSKDSADFWEGMTYEAYLSARNQYVLICLERERRFRRDAKKNS